MLKESKFFVWKDVPAFSLCSDWSLIRIEREEARQNYFDWNWLRAEYGIYGYKKLEFKAIVLEGEKYKNDKKVRYFILVISRGDLMRVLDVMRKEELDVVLYEKYVMKDAMYIILMERWADG